MSTDVLVTGGAGYIGSVLVEQLVENGHRVTVLDNLSRGHRQAVIEGASFVQADLLDKPALRDVFDRGRFDAVVHLAALTSVEQSTKDPAAYFDTNVTGGLNLLGAMLEHDVKKIVFSSSAAVYGQPESVPVSEDAPAQPVNAYGDSKLMFERILQRFGEAYGLRWVALRYFNVAGASLRFGADHNPQTNLIPIVIDAALGAMESLPVFGGDYATRDGTCIRDYIHVSDVARAHLLVLDALNDDSVNGAFNLGNGRGFTVMEVVAAARKVTGAPIPVEMRPRRAGDPPALVADYRQAGCRLGWQPEHTSLEEIINSAWEWRKSHPEGYACAYQR